MRSIYEDAAFDPPYSTAFPATENPISQNAAWVNGLAVGLDWNNLKTTGGQVVGTVEHSASRYADNIAVLNRTFRPTQFAEGTIYCVPGYIGNGGHHEIELHLRCAITAHVARGYEVIYGTGGYIAVVRWNGSYGNFTELYDSGGLAFPDPVDGDTLRAQIVGNILKVHRNNALVLTLDVSAGAGADNVWADGQPGAGSWVVDGAIPENLGWKFFRAGSL
jgi:hypothetical protein